jgi:xylan 1,4-beta-xylosidase
MSSAPEAGVRVSLAAPSEPLRHHWQECIGSGHAALALRADWQAQLRRCRRELGFERVRFHGILDDEVGTHIVQSGQPLDSFFNADRIMDFLVSLGMSPFVELSFMPTALASGDTTVFSYRGNVTPPADPAAWAGLIARLAGHWWQRYGRHRLEQWRFEVWNEPNLASFWTGTQADYFELYRRTALTIKGVDQRLAVGGPATAKNAWLGDFLAFCAASRTPLDFVSTHHYPTDAFGNAAKDIVEQLARSQRSALHDQAAAARAAVGGLPLHYTEWSMTSSPHDAQHDLPISAAYLIHAVLGVRGLVDGYSYWTFSDVFAENYFPSQPFHGGFGLLNLHGIPKPAYRAYAILHRLGDELWPVPSGHPTIETWLVRDDDTLVLLAVNLVLPGQPGAAGTIRVRIEDAPPACSCLVERIDGDHANPRRRWEAMGEPGYLDQRQVDELMACAAPCVAAHPFAYEDGAIVIDLALPPNGVAAATFALDATSSVSVPWRAEARAALDGDNQLLDEMQRAAFSYFTFTAAPGTGLVPDNSRLGAPASIAAIGFALAGYPVAVERGFMSRAAAAERARLAVRFLVRCDQGSHPDAGGCRGFFYHFLDPHGCRARDSELSTIDTALLIAGALLAAAYFDGDSLAERDLREDAEELYARVDWPWALDHGQTLRQGWQPHAGFMPGRWEGYSEALLLYVLACGSPTHPLGLDHYRAFSAGFSWRRIGDLAYLHAGPLFIHQYPHCFLDLRGIRDRFMREHECDYVENSRRATLVQQRYAMDNPHGFRGYGEHCWGITASDGPGQENLTVDGVAREFLGYRARGVPDGPDDGTIAPWAALASLPFAPEIVLPTIRHLIGLDLHRRSRHGFRSTFNLTYPQPGGWVGPWHYGINQGPAVLMVENHRTGLLWDLMRRVPALVRGLRRCGFTGGHLD